MTQSSASELCQLEDYSSSSPFAGLEECSTAAIGTAKESPRPDRTVVVSDKIVPVAAVISNEQQPTKCSNNIPRLRIAMLLVGTRGDVQPFLPVAKRLQEFGHHVRLATHVIFKDFVKSAGVEFYPLGGDPRLLAEHMVKTKGMIPSITGDISTQMKQLRDIIESIWPACTEPDTDTGAPFTAQAIIANPPAYGHVHVAEALGVPLHMFFTVPWTPTNEFPHPYARVPQKGVNWLSYLIVDLFIWFGIRSYINDLRKRTLRLPPIACLSMKHVLTSHLPMLYMWSPHVLPKPKDWGPLIDVVGYCFLDLGSNYQPPDEFLQWIQKGPKPIYIGFGSMPVENPRETTNIILEALKETGQRGILDRGWGHLGISSEDVAENIFVLENSPHDWLFPQCSAVVHHGGAGTTATAFKSGCPTLAVPFYGDQFFWAQRMYEKGLTPKPIPINHLSVEALSNAIRIMLQLEVKCQAVEIAKIIGNEDGVGAAVETFHRHLLASPPCSADPAPQHFFMKILNLFCLAFS